MVARFQKAAPVIKEVPGEMLHRAASYVIIAEGVFHTFHRVTMVVVAGIIFLLIESVAIYKEDTTPPETKGW